MSNKLKEIVWTTSKFGWTTFEPVSFQFHPVYFLSTSSFFSLLPIHFQSTSSLLPVYFQFSSRLQLTSKSTFWYHFFSFYDVWASNNPSWLIRLKPDWLQERKIYINIIDYPLCTVEKKWSNKLKQIVWTTSKFGWTTFVPVSFQFLPVYFQSTSSLVQSTSNLL